MTREALASIAALHSADVALALHETALRNHNLGEGPLRAICESAESHLPRAEAILAICAARKLADEGLTRDGLREALETILDICKPMSMSMSGPVWFDGGTPAGGGSRERIWRICDAALVALDAKVEETP